MFFDGSVNAVRMEDKWDVSDVLDVLLFFVRFVWQRAKSVKLIKLLLHDGAGMLDRQERIIFADAFSYLKNLKFDASQIC